MNIALTHPKWLWSSFESDSRGVQVNERLLDPIDLVDPREVPVQQDMFLISLFKMAWNAEVEVICLAKKRTSTQA